MTQETIRIEGSPEALEGLRRDLIAAADEGVKVEPISTAVPGELREPLMVALLISFSTTAGVIAKTVGEVIQRRMTHLERKELLQIYREKDGVKVDLEDLLAELMKK